MGKLYDLCREASKGIELKPCYKSFRSFKELELVTTTRLNPIIHISYISDLYLDAMIASRFVSCTSDEEIIDWLKVYAIDLARTIEEPGSYVCFAGDITGVELVAITFYRAFMNEYRHRVSYYLHNISKSNTPCKSRVFGIIGDYECRHSLGLLFCKQFYSVLFKAVGIKFLDNRYYNEDNFHIVGGIGELPVEAADDEETVSRELDSWQSAYLKARNEVESLGNNTVLVALTHTPYPDWAMDCTRNTVFVSGHTHENICQSLYQGAYYLADGQGMPKFSSFRYSAFGKPLSFNVDGIYDITLDEYKAYMQYFGASISGEALKTQLDSGAFLKAIYKNGYIGFFMVSDNRVLILNGGQARIVVYANSIDYVYSEFDSVISYYVDRVTPLWEHLDIYSRFIRSIGGTGVITGNQVTIGKGLYMAVDEKSGRDVFLHSSHGRMRAYPTLEELLEKFAPELLRNYPGDIHTVSGFSEKLNKFISFNKDVDSVGASMLNRTLSLFSCKLLSTWPSNFEKQKM